MEDQTKRYTSFLIYIKDVLSYGAAAEKIISDVTNSQPSKESASSSASFSPFDRTTEEKERMQEGGTRLSSDPLVERETDKRREEKEEQTNKQTNKK